MRAERRRTRAARRQSPWIRLAWGLIFLAAGTLLWLDQQDRIDAREYLEWWPLALVMIGLAHVPQRRWIAALAWILIGIVLLPELGLTHDVIRTLLSVWPLLITFGGLSLMAQALRPRGPGTVFHATAVMAGNTLLVGSQALAGADVVAVMGGCQVDLRTATPPARDVAIHVLAFWGGIDISVPAGWRVVDEVSQILGGFEDKTGPARDDAPRVIVRGSAIMGGVEVRTSEDSAA
jgi:predicted membrane protein